jgi:hypothetical protein
MSALPFSAALAVAARYPIQNLTARARLLTLFALLSALTWGCVPAPEATPAALTPPTTQAAEDSADAPSTSDADATPSTEPRPDPSPRWVVHEWGTFTSMQSAEGATLDGLHHVEELLPAFVHRRHTAAPQVKGLEVLPEEVNQKLETPVIYFYADQPTRAHVEVDFPQGIISEWFPKATSFAPPIGGIISAKIADGTMTWDVDVSPSVEMAKAPIVPEDSVWMPSRGPAATPIQVDEEVERFIFYRGLGRFTVPLTVRSTAQGLLELHNGSREVIEEAFLLHVHSGGGDVRRLGRVEAGGTLTAEPSPKERDLDAYVVEAMAEVEAGLIRAGLYEDEAKAMVQTWSRSYFRTPGLRVLYVVPRAWTDALLPLRITPTPDALVRVLMGRVEVLTPPEEFSVVQGVYEVLAGTKTEAALLEELGRFAEPKLRRAEALIEDPRALSQCQALIEAVRQIP